MNGMSREVPSVEPPHSQETARIVEAMLADGPPDAALLSLFAELAASPTRRDAQAQLREQDWANLGRYQSANAALIAADRRPDLVLIGNSITEIWPFADPDFFIASRVGRGIAGQTSPQTLLRFQADVVALRPKAVHLMCGTNDIAGNTGPTTPYRFQCNVKAMTMLAAANGIHVYLASIPPITSLMWQPEVAAQPWVRELNDWLNDWAAEHGHTYVDYHGAMADAIGNLRPEFSRDGVHPNRRGYAAMRRVLEPLLG